MMLIQHHRQPISTVESRNQPTDVREYPFPGCSSNSPLELGASTEGHHLTYADWLHRNAVVES
jgi:hypothetical protein